MSQENTNATTSESINVVEANINNNTVAIESAMDTTDNIASAAAVPSMVITSATETKTITDGHGNDDGNGDHGVGDLDIEAAKIKYKNENEAKSIEMSNNALKSERVVANGENNGNISKRKPAALTTTTTTTEITTATITPALAMPMKQQDQPVMDNPNAQRDESTANKGKMGNDAAIINFRMLYVVTQLCGLTMIILVGSWIGIHLGGVAGTADPSHEFNWHPLLMTIGLIFLYGNSILVYRGFRTTRKKTLKITHASIHMGAFILTVIALKTVFDSHNLAAKPIPNMYSLHSWLGLSSVLIFCMQYVCGFMAYMVPGLKEQYKIAYMPLHIYFGLFGFVLAIASALMGFTEKAIFSIPGYSTLPNSGVIANLSGVLFVIFGGLVVYLTTEPSYKRKPLPEDAVLLTGAHE